MTAELLKAKDIVVDCLDLHLLRWIQGPLAPHLLLLERASSHVNTDGRSPACHVCACMDKSHLCEVLGMGAGPRRICTWLQQLVALRCAQVLPLERGAGMAQMGMRKAEEVLGRGDWVHIFPEGTRTRDGRIGPARRGVARLISSCEQPPLGTAMRFGRTTKK